jgi:hypothetical protein
MATTLNQDEFLDVVKKHDWERTSLVLARYADGLLLKALARGRPITRSFCGALTLPDGSTAEDLTGRAVEFLLDPRSTRTWNPSTTPDLLDYLASVVMSLISNALTNMTDQMTEEQVDPAANDGEGLDLIESAEDLTGFSQLASAESAEYQEQIKHFRTVLADDKELQDLFDCLDAGYTKPADIEEFTKIPAARVSELKRKLRCRLVNHFLSDEMRARVLDHRHA